MENIGALLKAASKQYNRGLPHHDHCRQLVMVAHNKLTSQSQNCLYGNFAARPPVPYNVFSVGEIVSRPVRPDLYIDQQDIFLSSYDAMLDSLRAGPEDWSDEDVIRANRVVYSSVMSVACCYDLWKRGSRKTPGTFFEILMASFLQQMLPNAIFTKHIPLAALLQDPELADGILESSSSDEQEDSESSSVSTDLVIGFPSRPGGIVVPLKITTRERIVQPFAHQRILDSAFGVDTYQSLLVCISETQLDDKTRSVKQVCVPGTVKLFQRYLAPIRALYYCDLPRRYTTLDMQKVISVRSVGNFFIDVFELLKLHNASRN